MRCGNYYDVIGHTRLRQGVRDHVLDSLGGLVEVDLLEQGVPRVEHLRGNATAHPWLTCTGTHRSCAHAPHLTKPCELGIQQVLLTSYTV